MTLNTVHHESDLLVIGGGIAGLMTAIRAAELGLKVIVADKSNVRYSGAGATGNDHFQCYIPEYHGDDFNAWICLLYTSCAKPCSTEVPPRALFWKTRENAC